MMNNLRKIIIGIGLLPFAHLSAETSVELTAALKEFQPDLLTALESQGFDMAALEDNAAANPNNNTGVKPAEFVVSGRAPTPSVGCSNNGGIFLENNYVATCVSKNGTFGYGNESVGMTFNPSGSGTVAAPDFLTPGAAHEYFSIKTLGVLLTNNNTSPDTPSDFQSVTIAPLNQYPSTPGGVLVKSVYGPVNGYKLDMTQKYTVDPHSRDIIVRVEMHNTGQLVLSDLMYARGLDPDQQRPNNPFATLNRIGHRYFAPTTGGPAIEVHPDNIAWASGIKGLSVALYSVDPMAHKACISSTWTVDPSDVLNLTCGAPQPVYDPPSLFGYDYSDSTINMAFNLGHLQVGEKKVFSFKYLFNQRKVGAGSAVPAITIKPIIVESKS